MLERYNDTRCVVIDSYAIQHVVLLGVSICIRLIHYKQVLLRLLDGSLRYSVRLRRSLSCARAILMSSSELGRQNTDTQRRASSVSFIVDCTVGAKSGRRESAFMVDEVVKWF